LIFSNIQIIIVIPNPVLSLSDTGGESLLRSPFRQAQHTAIAYV